MTRGAPPHLPMPVSALKRGFDVTVMSDAVRAAIVSSTTAQDCNRGYTSVVPHN